MNIAKIVREAREQSRLTTLDFATGIFDDFIQLHGDRSFRDDGAVVGGIGWRPSCNSGWYSKRQELARQPQTEFWSTTSRRLSQGTAFDETG